jgi:2-dehydro-3-deoxyphosphogluconate aldolase/(4S)-4-hydroxy-2-oxoglutarate aldolase
MTPVQRYGQDLEIEPLPRLLGRTSVLPVLVIEDEVAARRLAEILVGAGLPVLEVTLRTRAALSALAAMTEVPGAVVGAGTVRRADDVRHAVDAGAAFCVSPGLTPDLARAAEGAGVPLLAGVSTASEIMCGLDLGLSVFKFFPAAASGGPDRLRDFHGPFPDVQFCPTGGLTPQSARDYLAQPNVLCVGGGWVAPPDLIAADDWAAIEIRAREAARLNASR